MAVRAEWANWVSIGEAAALVSPLRDYLVSPSPTDADNIARFFADVLFQASNAVPLTDLVSPTGYDGDLMDLSSDIDAREFMTELLQLAPQVTPRTNLSFIRLLRCTHHQLFVDTLRRKTATAMGVESPSSAESNLSHILETARATMVPWVQNMMTVVRDCVLPQMCQCDGGQEMVTTVIEAHQVGKDDAEKGGGGDDEVGKRTSEVCAAMGDNVFLMEVMGLCHDTFLSSGLTNELVETTLSVYATFFSAQRLSYAYDTYGVQCKERLRTLATRFGAPLLMESDKELRECGDNMTTEQTRQFTHHVMSFLERIIGREAVLRVLLRCLQPAGFVVDRSGGMFYADFEQGRAHGRERFMALWQMSEKATAAVTILDDDDYEADDKEGFDPGTVLCHYGALMLLGYLLCEADAAPSAFLSCSSASSMLMMSVYAFTAALQSTSRAALFSVLVFLDACVVAIPKYSMAIEGEDKVGGSLIDVLAQQKNQTSTAYHTQKYKYFFDLIKQLITVSALCPSTTLRRMSQHIALELLQRFEGKSRFRMHASLLVLTPFPGVARALWDALMGEWREYTQCGHTNKCDNDMVFEEEYPRLILQTQKSIVSHINRGEKDFVELLIVSLNFLRVFVSRDSHTHHSVQRLAYDKGKVDLSANKGGAWKSLFSGLRDDILPVAEVLAGRKARPESAVRIHPSTDVSPVDQFSLSSAIDGILVYL